MPKPSPLPPPVLDGFVPVSRAPVDPGSVPHDHRDFSLRVPDAFEDRTVVAYVIDGADGRPGASVLVRRVDSRDAQAYAARELITLAKTLPHFELLSTRERYVGSEPATEHVVRWRASYGLVVQKMVFVQGVSSTTFVVTGTAPAEDAERMLPVLETTVASFRVRRPSTSGFHSVTR